MLFVKLLSDFMIPMTFVIILTYGVLQKVPIYDVFIDGARDGLNTVVQILPTIVGLMVAVGILRASGAFELVTSFVSPITNLINFPEEALPLSFMRLVSSSAATGLLVDIYKSYGPDSFLGRFVSVMMSCTETVFYTMSVYFMSVKITKTRYTLAGALFANFVGVIISLYITKWAFS